MTLGNILETALKLLPTVTYQYRIYQGNEINELGISIPKYTEWNNCVGMLQPVESSQFEMFGITNGAKRAITVWGSIDFNTIDVQDYCDQVRYNGRVYNCFRCTDWNSYNGWHQFVCTEDKQAREDSDKYHQPTVEKVEPEEKKPIPPEGGGVKW